jgi:hypothetical protein
MPVKNKHQQTDDWTHNSIKKDLSNQTYQPQDHNLEPQTMNKFRRTSFRNRRWLRNKLTFWHRRFTFKF